MSRPVPYVQDDLCLHCTICYAQKVCRVRALVRIEPDDAPFLDSARCNGCLRCILACPPRIIREPGAESGRDAPSN